MSEPQAEAKTARLLKEADQVSRARLLAAARRKNGLWLHTLPTSTLGSLLNPESLRIAFALRVGADVCEPHMCRCGWRIDARGLHGLSYKFSAGRHPRHAALNDIINPLPTAITSGGNFVRAMLNCRFPAAAAWARRS